ncbi:MAG: aldehyde dehydrogenase family protein, partial [Emticicia sp.]
MKQVLKTLKIKSLNNGVSTGVESWAGGGKVLSSYSPVDGQLIGKVRQANREDYDKVIESANAAFKVWRAVPAPKRGEIVRQMGDALRANKDALGRLVSYEMGKSLQEG